MPKWKLLFDILGIPSVSGDEFLISQTIHKYILQRMDAWRVTPEIYYGEEFHDCILLKFGNPSTAIFAHVDTIGFMSRYENQLVTIGGPELISGVKLLGSDSLGEIRCGLIVDEDLVFHDFPRGIDPGTRLSFEQNIRLDEEFIQAAYLDNRLGVFSALKVCETLENGWVVFSTYEEHGGGSMPHLLRFIQENAPIKQALISDITWITEGVRHHQGVVLSIRDKYIPRKAFLDRVISLAKSSGIPFQLEVEAYGGSDGREVQFSPYAIDWCFVGAAEDHVHTPNEKVSLFDIECMIQMHRVLMEKL